MKNKGFTLMELAVVLAVIAILAAVMTPIVLNYVDQARAVRAGAETKTIADAIRAYQRDVGQYPIYDTTTASTNDTSSNFITTSSGNTPANTQGTWATSVATTSLESYLNNNYLGRTVMTTTGLGKLSFRGPYINSIDGGDPWSNKYYVTAAALQRAGTNWAFVISAGANGGLETSPTQARSGALAVSGDDIITVIK